MLKRNGKSIIASLALISLVIGVIFPMHAYGDVKQITQTRDRLNGITEEEKAVLKELFTINQKIDELNVESNKINDKIQGITSQMTKLEAKIDAMNKDYTKQLDLLKKVLVSYQRGGPASYLEILLGADDLSTFLKSLNTIKDISHNVKKLLVSIEDSKDALKEENTKLREKEQELKRKKTELSKNLAANHTLQKQKEDYLTSLKEDKSYYEEQLSNLELMWNNCLTIFPKLTDKITNAINDGSVSIDDLNMQFGILVMDGYLSEETFHRIISEDDQLSDITFEFKKNQVILNVLEEHLVLTGNFIISGESAIKYEVTSGTFYDMPLEQSAIEELFKNGPLLIDFKSISEGIITVEFTLKKVESKEDMLTFEISPKW